MAAIAWAGPAAADEAEPVWHAEYGIGGALGPLSGFRQNLDASAGVAFAHDVGRDLGAGQQGWLVGAAAIAGFHAYPTYLAAETGVTTVRIIGWSATVGPAVRVDPRATEGGGEASASLMVAFLRAGLRVVVMADGDTQICFTLGAGTE